MKPPGSPSSNTPLCHVHVACLLVPCSKANSYGSGGHPFVSLEFKKSPSPWEQNSPNFYLLPMGMLSFLSVISTNTQTHSLLFWSFIGPNILSAEVPLLSLSSDIPGNLLNLPWFHPYNQAFAQTVPKKLWDFTTSSRKPAVSLVQRYPCPDLIFRVCCFTWRLPGTIIWLPLCLTLWIFPFLPNL